MSDSGDDSTREERDARRKAARPLAVGDKVQVIADGRVGVVRMMPYDTGDRVGVGFGGRDYTVWFRDYSVWFRKEEIQRVSTIQPDESDEPAERIKILEAELAHWQHKAQCEAAELERLKARDENREPRGV